MSISHENIKVVTLNVNGFKNAQKRKALWNTLRSKHCSPNVILLQEVHLNATDPHNTHTKWGKEYHHGQGQDFWSFATGNSRGVGILVPANAPFDILTSHTDSTNPGRVVSITIKPKSNNCLLYTSPSPRDYAASRMPSSA